MELLCLAFNRIWFSTACYWIFIILFDRHLLLLLMKLARLINFYAFIQDHIGKLCLLRICKLLDFSFRFKLFLLILNMVSFIVILFFINKVNFACELGSNRCLIVRLVLILSWTLACSQICWCYCSQSLLFEIQRSWHRASRGTCCRAKTSHSLWMCYSTSSSLFWFNCRLL